MLRVAQTPDHLQAALTQLKGAMDKRGLHYDDLSGRPKNLCAPLLLVPDLTVTPCWRSRDESHNSAHMCSYPTSACPCMGHSSSF